MADYFPSGSVIRRVNIEPALMFGAGRALLLQLSHPHVAQGVEDHSEFRTDPFKRLQGTAEATFSVVFGSERLARGVGERIQWVHDFVTGPGYRANDPAALLWVHATLMDTALLCYQQLVGPLSPDDQESYYQDMKRVAEVFGVPLDAQPADLAAFNTYFDEMVESFEVTDVSRSLVDFLLYPPLPTQLRRPTAPIMRLQRLATIGTTPESLRQQFGLRWDARSQRRLERARFVVRSTMNATPRPLRVGPNQLGGELLLRQAARNVSKFRAQLAERQAPTLPRAGSLRPSIT